MIVAKRDARVMAEADAAVAKAAAANAQADLSSSEALIAHLKLAIEKLRDLNPARCQRTRVSGLTIANASQILGNNR